MQGFDWNIYEKAVPDGPGFAECRLVPQSHQSLAGDRQFYFSVLKTVKNRTFDFFVHILTIILCRLEYCAGSANIHEHSLLP
jgi:hypothetical protein